MSLLIEEEREARDQLVYVDMDEVWGATEPTPWASSGPLSARIPAVLLSREDTDSDADEAWERRLTPAQPGRSTPGKLGLTQWQLWR